MVSASPSMSVGAPKVLSRSNPVVPAVSDARRIAIFGALIVDAGGGANCVFKECKFLHS